MGYRIASGRAIPSVRTFAGRESGSLTIFSLFVILCMLMVGGLAVDFMRQESARAKLQSTLDRAILAAADMDQQLDPTSVVEDYFARAGLDGYKLKVTVSEGLTARRVSAVTTKTLDSYFLNFIGINTLTAPASGAAEESLSNIEISLVLDVSGSMGDNQKLQRMKVAAKEFVDLIFAQTAPGKTTISIVPYSTQVNAGPNLLKFFNATAEHSYSNCVDFADADYDTPVLTTTELLQRTGHFDPTAGEGQKNASTFVCRTTGGTEVFPVSSDPEALKAKIDSLVATGWTSIDVGVKWGSALLQPELQPAISGMIADGTLPATSAGRPYANNLSETQKIIVVMTDGINTTQWYLDNRYRTGLSDVFRDPATGKLSVKGIEPLLGDGDLVLLETYYIPGETGGKRWQNAPIGGAAAVQLTYPQLWASTSVRYNARQMANKSGNPLDFLLWTSGVLDIVANLFQPGVFSSIEGEDKDDRLRQICSAAKTGGVKIYSIGFEVTDASAVVMEDCATTSSHFFRVAGPEIIVAFQKIANDIGKLRLTQ